MSKAIEGAAHSGPHDGFQIHYSEHGGTAIGPSPFDPRRVDRERF